MTPDEMAERLDDLVGMLERNAVTFKHLDYRETTERDSAQRDVTTVSIVLVYHPPDRREP